MKMTNAGEGDPLRRSNDRSSAGHLCWLFWSRFCGGRRSRWWRAGNHGGPCPGPSIIVNDGLPVIQHQLDIRNGGNVQLRAAECYVCWIRPLFPQHRSGNCGNGPHRWRGRHRSGNLRVGEHLDDATRQREDCDSDFELERAHLQLPRFVIVSATRPFLRS